MRKQYPAAQDYRSCWAHLPRAYSTPALTAAHAAPLDRASNMETTAAALPAPMTPTTTAHQTAANTAPRARIRLTAL